MIQVAILDHHQIVLNGYRFRFKKAPDIEIVAAMHYGEEVEPLVTENPIDVLILAVSAPTAPDNKAPYPILHLIPKLRQNFPDLAILIIAMHKQAALTEAVLAAGASGYICKDDQAAIKNLNEIIRTIAEGGRYLSDEAKCKTKGGETILTPRQREALSISAAYPGATTTELAQRLNIAGSTMRNLLSKAYHRLGVTNRTAAIAEARRIGLLPKLPIPPAPMDD